MTNNNLIPFTKELWETGEYEAVTKKGINAIIYEIIDHRIYGRVENNVMPWYFNGQAYNNEYHNDLMLRKKTKKRWIPILKIDIQSKPQYSSKKECDDEWLGNGEFTQAIEVEI